MKKTIACFTGHRPSNVNLGGYDYYSPKNRAITSRLKEEIGIAYEKGYRTFISGMALGVDQLAMQAVLDMRNQWGDIKAIAAIPFVGQAAVWSHQSKLVWLGQLDRADKIINTDTERVVNFDDIVAMYDKYKPIEPRLAVSAMLTARNEWMVNNSSRLIAVYAGGSGGTAHCIHYARSRQLDIRIINPKEVI